MSKRWHLSRRTVLRGFGAAVALPFLEAMVKPGARAQAATPPRRFVGIWGLPCGVVGKRDAVQGCRVAPWTPAVTGSILSLTPDRYLQPFFAAGLQSKITVLTGLSDRQSTSHNCAGLLGSMLPNAATVSVGAGGTADYIIATEHKRSSPELLPSLVLSAAPQSSGGNGVFRKYISFAPNQPLPVERSPKAVFDRLFGAASGQLTAQEQAEAERRRLYDQSVLDAVREDANALASRLGSQDRARLDQYLTGVRELEEQLVSGAKGSSCGTSAPPDDLSAAALADPAQLDTRTRLLLDVIVKAFECDRTRVATFMFLNAYGMSPLPHLGLTGGFHATSHYISDGPAAQGSQEAARAFMDTYTVWVLQRYAYLMAELDRRVEADGSTLLDNSVLYMSGEHCDSHGHTNGSMPVILGGRGGKDASGGWAISAGRHVRYPAWAGGSETMPRGVAPGAERSVRDLLWAIINLVGRNVTAFGEARAPLNLKWSDATAS